MAPREINLTEEEKAALTQTFISFEEIGQKFKGRLVKTQPQTGQYAKKDQLDYVFKYKNPAEGQPGHKAGSPVGAVVESQLKSQADINQKFRKVKIQPGWVAEITYLSDLDIGKENPMKQYKVLVDDAPAAAGATPDAAAVAAAAAKAAAEAAAKAASGADDDVNF